MRSLRFALAIAGLITTTAFASPADPQAGKEYTLMPAPQPVQVVGKKIEVIEFFAYHCPACNMMELPVAMWVKKQGANINFRRMAFPFQGPTDPETHLFLTLEAMGKAEEIGPKVFQAFHVERKRLNTDEAIMEWIPSAGVDKAKFVAMWNSFGVLTKLKRMPQVAAAYNAPGTPTFIIDGKYMTSPTQVETANPRLPRTELIAATQATLDALVAKAQKEKGFSAPAAKPAAK